MTGDGAMSFDEFVLYISEGLDLEPVDVVTDARLVEDLGLDSFDLTELLALVEELRVRFPEEVAVSILTVGDLYREYAARASR